jgi:hypothetical protein
LLLTKTGVLRVGLPWNDGNALAELIDKNRVTPWNPVNLSGQIDQTWEDPRVANAAESALKALGMILTTERRQPVESC